MSCNCAQPAPPPPSAPANTCGSCRQTTYLRRYPTGCGCGMPKQQCKCHEPETPLCVPCQEPPVAPCTMPRAIKLHITISPDDAGTCFPFAVCGCGADLPDISQLVARFRRRGQCDWLLEYPAWDCSECGIEFRWDSQLTELPKGRYELQFFNGEDCCGVVEVTFSRKCPINAVKATAIKQRKINMPTETPFGAHPVFDSIASFTANLCNTFDRPDTALPLCPADLTQLCSISVCKPVELMLFDGYNSELVTFTGCTSGAALVTRGSPRHKFPKGSNVRFVWSENNVKAACSPCP